MKIVFMGTPDFARDSLKAVVEAGHEVALVVTNPDKPKGRGMKLIPSDVKKYAIEQNLEVVQPVKVRNNPEFVEQLKNINPDVICVVAYGKIIPKEILDIPRLGCINVHGSLLPKYRGSSPIQWSILNGDKETGITTMFMDVGMDTGDMINKEVVQIGDDETTGELWDRLSIIGAKLLVKTLKDLENGTYKREKQGDDFTVAPMIKKEMAKIDWENKSAQEIKNLVRGLNPIMGTYSYLNGKKIKIWKVDVVEADSKDIKNGTVLKSDSKDGLYIKAKDDIINNQEDLSQKPNGTIIKADQKEGLFIKTKKGILKVIEIQGENAKRMNVQDFLRGNQIEVGSIFE